jgi:hypothetical protein
MRPVTLGLTNEGEAVIAKGIAAGEVVVREGQFLLGPGSRVEVKELAAKEGTDGKAERRRRGKAKAEAKGES